MTSLVTHLRCPQHSGRSVSASERTRIRLDSEHLTIQNLNSIEDSQAGAWAGEPGGGGGGVTSQNAGQHQRRWTTVDGV